MLKNPSRFSPCLESLEQKVVLATVLTTPLYHATLRELHLAATVEARTGNTDRADAVLARAVDRLPGSNNADLLTELEAALATFDGSIRGSARYTEVQLINDLDAFLGTEVAAGTITARGPVYTRLTASDTVPLHNAIEVENSSDVAIRVNISDTNRTLSRTRIAAGQTAYVFYRTATQDTIDAYLAPIRSSSSEFVLPVYPGAELQATSNGTGGINVTYLTNPPFPPPSPLTATGKITA